MEIGAFAMFKIGDVIVYSVHGLSKIDDIVEKTIHDETKKYYVLHPLDQSNLTISTPVDNEKVVMLKMMDQTEAKEILKSFGVPGASWIEDTRQRAMKYKEVVMTGNRMEIAKIANTLMRKSNELSLKGKKLYDQDRKILTTIQNILFKELSLAMNSTYEKVSEQVEQMVKS